MLARHIARSFKSEKARALLFMMCLSFRRRDTSYLESIIAYLKQGNYFGEMGFPCPRTWVPGSKKELPTFSNQKLRYRSGDYFFSEMEVGGEVIGAGGRN